MKTKANFSNSKKIMYRKLTGMGYYTLVIAV